MIPFLSSSNFGDYLIFTCVENRKIIFVIQNAFSHYIMADLNEARSNPVMLFEFWRFFFLYLNRFTLAKNIKIFKSITLNFISDVLYIVTITLTVQHIAIHIMATVSTTSVTVDMRKSNIALFSFWRKM